MSKNQKHTQHFHCASGVYGLDNLDNTQLYQTREIRNRNTDERIKIYQHMRDGDVSPLPAFRDDVDRDLSHELWHEKTYNNNKSDNFALNYCDYYHDCKLKSTKCPHYNWNKNNWYKNL